jgi:hypothetical protein
MLHQHNPSTPLSYQRQSIYYPPDGTGRDAYIRTDNGGTNIAYRIQGVPETGNFMKFGSVRKATKPGSYTRYQKYLSDGSGRDKYVISRQGGQYNEEDENSVLLIKFRTTMRDGGWKPLSQNTTTFYKTASDLRTEHLMNRTQSIAVKRLSAPKRKSEKYLSKLEEMRRKFQK